MQKDNDKRYKLSRWSIIISLIFLVSVIILSSNGTVLRIDALFTGGLVGYGFIIASVVLMFLGGFVSLMYFWNENPKIDIMATVFYGLSIGLLTVGLALWIIFVQSLNLLFLIFFLIFYFLNVKGFLFSMSSLAKSSVVKNEKRIVRIFFGSMIIMGICIIVGVGIVGKNFEKERERIAHTPNPLVCLSDEDRRER